jgi:hypothetical protein
VQGALAKVPQVKELKTHPDTDGGTATFKVPKDFDYKAALDAIAKAGNKHVADWSVAN